MARHAVLPRHIDQLRQLDAVPGNADATAVNQCRADHDAAHALLRRGTCWSIATRIGLLGLRRERRVLVEGALACLSVVVGADHARTAGLDQRLAAALQPIEQRVHDERIVRICRVDHGIDALCDLDERRVGVELARERLDPALLQRRRSIVRSREPDHLIAAFDELRRDRTADVAGRACDEDFHGQSSGLSGTLPSGTGTCATFRVIATAV